MLFAKVVRTGEVEERPKERGEQFQSPEKVEELVVEDQVKEVNIVSIVLSLNWQEEEPRFYTEEEQEELDGI